jgi:putative DNA primase/helicase
MAEVVKLSPRMEEEMRRESASVTSAPSEDAMALAFVDAHVDKYRYVPPWSKWYRWDGKRWKEDSTGRVFAIIRKMVRAEVGDTKDERKTANSAYVAGVERLARCDQRIVVLPEQFDSDPWLLNTQSGMVDLRGWKNPFAVDGVEPHDPAMLCTRITAECVPEVIGDDDDDDDKHVITIAEQLQQGEELWQRFLTDITQGDAELAAYLQRVAGYCASGATTEDVLVYLFGIGANGKSSFAEAIAYVLGDYAKVFPAEVLMESKGERHPTDLAQFMGVRFALTSEPASSATWNDSRIKSLTGDAEISARFMRGDFFTFPRTHKTVVIGNHMPKLSAVTHAIRRRVQMVPFRAVFERLADAPIPEWQRMLRKEQVRTNDMRQWLKDDASNAILRWIIEGARLWHQSGTAPPQTVTDLTADYLDGQDDLGQWLEERCERDAKSFERSGDLHKNYAEWCEGQGLRAKSNKTLSGDLISAGFDRRPTMVGKVFYGIRLKPI